VAKTIDEMRSDWDRRALDDPLYWVYVVYGRQFNDRDFYFKDGASHAVQMVAPHLKDWGQDPSGKTILEVGSGIGRLFPGFAQLGFSRIVGVDVSPEMVSRGQQWCPVAGAEFLIGDGDRLTSVESCSVDYCFSYNVLGHLPSSNIFWHNIEEMCRVLRPGGYLQAHFRGWQSLKRRIARRMPDQLMPAARSLYRAVTLRAVRGAKRHDPGDPGHRRTFEFGAAVSPKRVVKRLRAIGFSDVKTETDPGYVDGSRLWVLGRKGAVRYFFKHCTATAFTPPAPWAGAPNPR
jgi:SAM-dependent methyltransferase